MKKWLVVTVSILAVFVSVFTWYFHTRHEGTSQGSVLKFGISPFQDTLVPTIGENMGWYRDEGIDVRFVVLGWTQLQQALATGQVDIVIGNISTVIGAHPQDPDLVYWYGLNPFDNGFALVIRPNGKLKTLQEIEASDLNHATALKVAASQLKGKTVVTTSNTDMEQGVTAAAELGGLDFGHDVKVIDMDPDQGLAAFLRGEGDAYIGGIPQRTEAERRGMVDLLTGVDLGPPPINGIITTKEFAAKHEEVLLKILHIWFRSVQYIDANEDNGAKIIVDKMAAFGTPDFTVGDFKKYWNNYEHYPANAREVQSLILDSNGKNYWLNQWNGGNYYFFKVKRLIPNPVDPRDAFLMQEAQRDYVAKYGWSQ